MYLKQIFKNSLVLVSIFTLLVFTILISFNPKLAEAQTASDVPQVDTSSPIAEEEVDQFRYSLSYKDNYNSSSAVISIPTNLPAILDITSEQTYSGSGKFQVYQLNKNDLLEFLTYSATAKDENSIQIDQTKKEYFNTSWPQIASFERLLNLSPYQPQKLDLPLNSSGIYLLKSNVNQVVRDTIIVRSQYGLIAKKTQTGLLFWGQDLENGKSLDGGQVELYRTENQSTLLSRGDLDNTGILEIPTDIPPDIAIGEFGGQLIFVPLNLNNVNAEVFFYRERNTFENFGTQNKIFIFCDRPIYKPGDTVKFKAITRDYNDIEYSLPVQTEFQAKVSYYQNDPYEEVTILDQTFTSDSRGGIDGSFTLPSDSPTGEYYQVRIEPKNIDNDNYRFQVQTSFQVENYVKPEFELSINSPIIEYISGDLARFDIEAKYYSGQKVTNQKVKYKLYSSDFDQYSLSNDISKSLDYQSYDRKQIGQGQLSLDNLGQGTIEINVKAELPAGFQDTSSTITSGQIVTLEVQLDNGLASPAVDTQNVLVYNGDYSIFPKDYNGNFQLGSTVEIPLELIPNKSQNANVVANQKIEFSGYINRWELNSSYNPEVFNSQKYYSVTDYITDIPPLEVDSVGQGIMKFNPIKAGSYTVTAFGIDNNGRQIARRLFFSVSEQGQILTSTNDSSIKISVDKQASYYNSGPTDKYKLGDNMQVQVELDKTNQDALITIERNFVREWQIVKLVDGKVSLEQLIKESYVPDMSITASSFSGSRYLETITRFSVDNSVKKLNIDIQANNSYKPGQTIVIDFQVKDSAGEGVESQNTVLLVDKSLLSLTENTYPDILESFWSDQYGYVRTSNSLMPLQSNFQGGLGGAGGDGPITRQNFEDLAYWNPAVITDVAGNGKINLTLPDNLTTWVILIYSADGLTRVGQNTKEIKVSQDTVVRPIVPQTFIPDQELALGMRIQNFSDQAQTLNLNQSFDGGQIVAVSDKSVVLEPGQETTTHLLIKVGLIEKNSRLVFEAKTSSGQGDSVAVEIPIKQPTFATKNIQVSDKQAQWPIRLSPDSKIEQTSIELFITPTLLNSLPEQSRNLLESSFCSCTSLLVAKLQTLLTAKNNPLLFEDIIEYSKIDIEVKSTMARLSTIQNQDGGWSSWGGDGPTDLWTTLLVAKTLFQASSAGFKVEPRVFEDLAFLSGASLFDNPQTRPFAQIISNLLPNLDQYKFQVYPLQDLATQDPDLIAIAAWTKLNSREPSSNLTERLVDLLNTNDREAFLEEVSTNNSPNSRYTSRRFNTALALEAMILSQEVDQNSIYQDLINKSARYLNNLDNRSNYNYGTELSQNLVGQVAFFETTNQIGSNLNWEVLIDGKLYQQGTLEKSSDLEKITIDPSSIKLDGSNIEVRSNNQQTFYSTLVTNEQRTEFDNIQEDKGLNLSRKLNLVNLDGSVSEVTGTNSLKTGDVVQIDLTVIAEQVLTDNDLIVVEEQVPGGWQVINSNLVTQTFDSLEPVNAKYTQEFTQTGINFITNQIPISGMTMSYRARVVISGNQQWLPASAQTLGSNTKNYTGSLKFQVQPTQAIKWQILATNQTNTEISAERTISFVSSSSSQIKIVENKTDNRLIFWIGAGLIATSIVTAIISLLLFIKHSENLKNNNSKTSK